MGGGGGGGGDANVGNANGDAGRRNAVARAGSIYARVGRGVISRRDLGAGKGETAVAAAAATATTAEVGVPAVAATVVDKKREGSGVATGSGGDDDEDIYLPGGRGAGLRRGLEQKPTTPPVLWSKPVTSKLRRANGRFRVVLAGQEDLDEAGALCIKVGGRMTSDRADVPG